MRAAAIALAGALAWVPAAAQSSASFRLAEATFNAGASGPASPAFRITLDAIGDPVAGLAGSSASYRLDAGFVAAYRPPSEVRDLRFPDATSLEWRADAAAGTYALYRDALATLPGGFGACLQSDLAAPGGSDAQLPMEGQGFFYLATARNRLREEGSKGAGSSGAERGNGAPCP